MIYCPKCANTLIERPVDGSVRKTCSLPECGFVHWDNPIPGVAGLVQYDNNIILARNTKWPGGLFSIITGFLEKNEMPEAAVARELKEELGLECDVQALIGHYPFPEMNQILIAYWLNGSGNLNLGEEIAETKIVSLDSLKHYDFTPLYLTEKIVKDWFQVLPISKK